ncbi:hypothetical protein BJY01DRAFT_248320 [Aspergillus pseudoustus]|uniref:Uncharacterized protein n=1 Tax=Aspergillus pseudoustus TaxID=1810923 RepID=A0ABR4JVJ7_9EURO
MEPDAKYLDPPPPYEETAAEGRSPPILRLEPVTLVLDGQFERLEPNNCVPEKLVAPEAQQCEPQYRHLFYPAHPSDAQYRTDIPAYYITAVDKETLGNIHLGTSKSRLRKMEFEALLTSTLFTARPAKLMGSRYNWIQEDGSQVAVEEGKDDEDKMVIAAPMTEEMRDALVAVWMLKLWYETAETRQAKREELERMMPPVSSYQDWNYAKKVGTLGGFAGAGGGGNGC